MEKETKTYRYEKEVIKHAEKNPLIPSFAEWASDRYKKEFMHSETLSAKMRVYTDMADECKTMIEKLKNEQDKGLNIDILNNKELEWIKIDAPDRIKRATFEGVYKAFCNEFGRKDINRRQFRLLIEQFQQKTTPKEHK